MNQIVFDFDHKNNPYLTHSLLLSWKGNKKNQNTTSFLKACRLLVEFYDNNLNANDSWNIVTDFLDNNNWEIIKNVN